MRTISIRQFNRNFYNELKNMPFAVSRRRTPIFSVNPIDVMSKKDVVTPKSINDMTVKTCKHGVIIGVGYCTKGCK